ASVIGILRHLRVNKLTYYSVRDRQYSKGDRIKRAAYFIYLNKTSWNGLHRVNRQGQFNVPAGRIGPSVSVFDEESLHLASGLLKRAKLVTCDFEETVEESRRGDLVYFDPPYITTHLTNGFIKYNSKLFREADELRLASVADHLASRGVHVIVSNAAHPLISQQYSGAFYRREFRRRSPIAADATKRLIYPELVLSTFPL